MKTMRKSLQRRSVYAATIVAILAMVAGYALAANLLLPFATTNVQGNQGAVQTGNTIYSPGISGSQLITGIGGAGGVCTVASSVNGATEVTVTAWVQGGPGACNGVSDYVLQLNFTSVDTLTAATYHDKFVFSSEFGVAVTYTTDSVTAACVLSGALVQCQTDINIDTGIATTAAQPVITAVDVTVTGS